MANPARVEALVRRLETDTALRDQITAAPSPDEKRALLDQNGFADVTIDDVKAYRDQTLLALSDEQLDQVAGGMSDAEAFGVGFGMGTAAVAASAVAG